METTNRTAIITGAIFTICLIISIVALALAIVRGDHQVAGLIFISVGLTARSFILWLDENL